MVASDTAPTVLTGASPVRDVTHTQTVPHAFFVGVRNALLIEVAIALVIFSLWWMLR